MQLIEDINELTTEEKIKVAATKVFIRKGYAATKTRDIAEEAGINIASLHYYYRSKEKLFEIVIGDSLKRFSKSMDEIFSSQIPLHEKVKRFVVTYIDVFKDNPMVPNFVLSESQTNPELMDKLLANQSSLLFLKKELKELSDKGIIRPIHHAQFIMNMMGLTIFPFLAKPIISRKAEITNKQYDTMIEERKQIIPEMIIGHLYLKKPED